MSNELSIDGIKIYKAEERRENTMKPPIIVFEGKLYVVKSIDWNDNLTLRSVCFNYTEHCEITAFQSEEETKVQWVGRLGNCKLDVLKALEDAERIIKPRIEDLDGSIALNNHTLQGVVIHTNHYKPS